MLQNINIKRAGRVKIPSSRLWVEKPGRWAHMADIEEISKPNRLPPITAKAVMA
jgi:hypothetical protein